LLVLGRGSCDEGAEVAGDASAARAEEGNEAEGVLVLVILEEAVGVSVAVGVDPADVKGKEVVSPADDRRIFLGEAGRERPRFDMGYCEWDGE